MTAVMVSDVSDTEGEPAILARMIRRHALTSFALLGLTIALTAAPPTISDRGRAALSDFLRTSVSRGDTPAVVGLVTGPDRVLFEDAAGMRSVADHVAATPDTIF